jgi:NAD(P) transhydrogenase
MYGASKKREWRFTMEELFADVLIIGSGPAGQKAAIQVAKLGKTAVIVEKDAYPGGSSLNRGTIPSKTLRESILDLTRFHDRSYYGANSFTFGEVNINDLNYRLQKILEDQRRILHRQFKKNNIRLIHGCAKFKDELQVEVFDNEDKLTHQILFESVIIAVGSRPRNPIGIPFDDKVILDSTTLLNIDELPKEMIVMGGGIVGSEYASFFAALGTKVTIVDRKEHVLPYLDSEIGIHMQTGLSEIGLQMLPCKEPKKIYRTENNTAFVEFTDGTTIEGETLLYALGRQANVSSLTCENAGVFTNKNGYVPVNALFQTIMPHIYAVGDVIGGPCLSSTSMEQGRLAARHACGIVTHHFPDFYPIGIYTIPEISSIGYTEEQLQKLGFRYEVGRAYYYEIARGNISGNDRGIFKILFHADTLEILGIHIIGRGATEVIHIGQVAMSFNAKIDYFIDQIFNYPTFAEGYRIAALNGMNKIAHKL